MGTEQSQRTAIALIAVALLALVAYSAWHRYGFLASSPFPLGIDGYFYPIQLRSLLETGHLIYPASPLALWLMWPLAAITDPMTGAKLGAAWFGALIALPAYGVAWQLTRHRGAALIAAVTATLSAGSYYLSIEFVKNGVGITVGVGFVWLALRALQKPGVARVGLALVGLAAAFLTHKMAAAVGLVLIAPAIVVEIIARGSLTKRRVVVIVIAAGAIVAGVLALGVAFPHRFLSLRDLELVRRAFSSTLHWTAPALALPDDSYVLSLDYEALIGGVLCAVALIVVVRGTRDEIHRAARATTIAVLLLGIFIALPFLNIADPQGLGFRLRVVAFVPLAMAAAIIASAIARRVPRAPYLATAIAALLSVCLSAEHDEGVVTAHPALVSAVIGLGDLVPAGDTIIVSERQTEYMTAWYTHRAVNLRPEAAPAAHRWRLLPKAYIGDNSPLDRALLAARAQASLAPPIGTHAMMANGLVVVPEATWVWVLSQLPPTARAYYERWPTS